MPAKIHLSQRLMTGVFWEAVLIDDDMRGAERARLIERLKDLEALRQAADYNTGSISFAAAWCLYNLVRYFQPARVLEVGTFIGKSTVSMASAMDDAGAPGEIHTCDMSNAIDIPWDGRTAIRQHQRVSSTDMLGSLDGAFDLMFLDGRLVREDLAALGRLATPDTVIALDDFEGMEKGVANLSLLAGMPKFQRHFLVYPLREDRGALYGLSGNSLTAVLVPVSTFIFTKQG